MENIKLKMNTAIERDERGVESREMEEKGRRERDGREGRKEERGNQSRREG